MNTNRARTLALTQAYRQHRMAAFLRVAALPLLAALALAAGIALSRAETTQSTVHFAAGQSSATLDGSLVRGDSAIYSFDANAGQEADIKVTSLEDNASFMLYQPPASVSQSDDGVDINGTAMTGDDDAKTWNGKLPASGTYYILVGGDRGNATYKLTVAVK